MASRIIIHLLLAAAFGVSAFSQTSQPSATDGPSTRDIVVLVDVGVRDDEILDFLDRRGWPADLSPETASPIFQRGIGKRLRAAILEKMYGQREKRSLVERFNVYSIDEPRKISMLLPKGYVPTVVSTVPTVIEFRRRDDVRICFGTRYFLFHLDLGSRAIEFTEPALKRGAFEALLDSMSERGLSIETPIETLLSDTAGKHQWPLLIVHLKAGARTGQGVLLATLVRSRETGEVTVLGATTGPDVSRFAIQGVLDDLADMAGSLR